MKIHNECWDVTEIAGREYNTCLTSYTRYLDNLSAEQYCECYSNTFAKTVKDRKPQITPAFMMPLRGQALTQCKQPQFYQRYAREDTASDPGAALQ